MKIISNEKLISVQFINDKVFTDKLFNIVKIKNKQHSSRA